MSDDDEKVDPEVRRKVLLEAATWLRYHHAPASARLMLKALLGYVPDEYEDIATRKR